MQARIYIIGNPAPPTSVSLHEHKTNLTEVMTMEETTQQEARVPCPYCKETILQGAIKCKHCGSNLRRQASLTGGNWIWARNLPDRKILGVSACIAANFR